MRNGSHRSRVMLQYVLCVLLLTGLDQWTKHLAVKYLKGQPDIPLIPNVLSLHYLENRGAAFGLFQNKQIFFIITTIVILAAVLYVLWKMPEDGKYLFLRIICFVITAGAIGNFIDRLRLNYVIDFIYFSLIDFPVFNVADIYVTVSMIFVLLMLFLFYKEEDFLFLKRGWKENE